MRLPLDGRISLEFILLDGPFLTASIGRDILIWPLCCFLSRVERRELKFFLEEIYSTRRCC